MVASEVAERGTDPAGLAALTGRSLEDILAAAAASVAPPPAAGEAEIVLQDYVPLARSLEFELSAHYWRQEGVRAFSANAVPFIVNNSGRLSECAAQLLFGHCLEVAPPATIDILELGAGCGLFALYFLDAFRAVCERQNRDFYDRVRYVVTDGATETVSAWSRNDQFAEHGHRAVLAVCDATGPLRPRRLDGEPVALPPLRAVFANYLLDSLPIAIVRQGEPGAEQLCIRTTLDAAAFRAAHPDRQSDELLALAASSDPATRARLLPDLGLFAIRARYQSDGADRLPFLADALALVEAGQRTLLNHGALTCLERCAGLLAADGIAVIADYGPTTPPATSDEAVLTRFGSSSAAGLSFPLLERAAAGFGLSASAPEGDDGLPVHVRLFARAALPFTRDTLKDRYSLRTLNLMEAPLERARRLGALDDVAGALASYQLALQHNRQNWTVMAEVATFMSERGIGGAVEVARHALAKNPWYAGSLWVLLGDCLFRADDMAGARAAFKQALLIDPSDAAAHHGLSYVHAAESRFEDAAHVILAGLLADRRGGTREPMLRHLSNVLASVSELAAETDRRLLRRSQAFESTS